MFGNRTGGQWYRLWYTHDMCHFFDSKVKAIKNGDNKSISIASASIIAKVIRDNLMKKLSNKYPDFFWNKNSGYGTKLHIDKIKLLGITPHHRKSFKPIIKMLE